MAQLPAPSALATALAESGEVVRIFLRDWANRNRLTLRQEWSDAEVNNALRMALHHFNGAPPMVVTYPQYQDAPEHMRHYWLPMGAAGLLIQGLGLQQLRNQVQLTTDDDEVVGVDQNGQLHMQVGVNLFDVYKQWVDETKVSVNLNSAYGRISSPYANVPSGFWWRSSSW